MRYAGDSQQQHLLDQFSGYIRTPTIISDVALRKIFNSNGDVFAVTSSFPGMGKTEHITQQAFKQGKMYVRLKIHARFVAYIHCRLATFPVSGPITRSRLIVRLSGHTFEDEFECLHIDLGSVANPYMISTFLFEMLVVGSVSSGLAIYSLFPEEN